MEFSFNYAKARSGQLEAINKIIDNVRRGIDFTPIILPTGYGKSDVIRLSAIGLYGLSLTPASIIVSPNTTLRDQIISDDKVVQMAATYDLKTSFSWKYSKLDKVRIGMPYNDDVMMSATIQLLTQPYQLQLLEQWVDSITYKTGMRPVLHIDESHLLSNQNTWGSLAITWRRSGGLVVLYTATPERHDNIQIPGIPLKTIDIKPVQIVKVKPGATPETIRISVYEAIKQQVTIDMDYIKEFGIHVKFQTAWNENIICHIQRIPFDIELARIDAQEPEGTTKLSELPEGHTRTNLGKFVRSAEAVMAGARLMIDALTIKQKLANDCAAIVFCGNDTDNDKDANAHAKAIEKAIKRINPALDVVIATSATGNADTPDENMASELIRAFAGTRDIPGKGDVLIVKQMASVGLDIPRLKVILDLSPTRTAAAFIQRINRATRPYKGIYVAVYVTPDDCIGQALFRHFVEDEHGDISKTSAGELISEYEKPKDGKKEAPLFIAEDVSMSGMGDTKGQTHTSEYYGVAQNFLTEFPYVSGKYTHNDIAAFFTKNGMTPPAGEEWTAYGGNSGYAVEDKRNECAKKAKEITNKLIGYDPQNPQFWRSTLTEVWTKAKTRCGLSPKGELGDIRDFESLKRLHHMLEVMYKEVTQ